MLGCDYGKRREREKMVPMTDTDTTTETDEVRSCPYCGRLPEISRGDSRYTVIEHRCPIVGYMMLELLNVRKDDFESEKRRCIKRWNMRRNGYSDD